MNVDFDEIFDLAKRLSIYEDFYINMLNSAVEHSETNPLPDWAIKLIHNTMNELDRGRGE